MLTPLRDRSRWALLLACCVLLGCGGGDDAEPTTSDDPPQASTPQTTTAAPDGVTNGTPGEPPKAWVNTATGQKMVGQVPLDVWFPSPLAVAANQNAAPGMTPTPSVPGTPIAANPSPTPSRGMGGGMSAPAPQPTPAATGTPAAGGMDWSWLPVTVVQDEVKNSANDMRTGLASVSSYNAEYENIQVKGAIIAGLAELALDHPGDIRWKDKAKYLRNAAISTSEKAGGRGGKFKRETEFEFEKITELLAGSIPAGMEESIEDDRPYADIADRMSLMERIESSSKWLSSNIITKERFDEEQEKIKHEGAVLAALFQIVSHNSYDSADEEAYKKFVSDAMKDSRSILDAAEVGSFDQFKTAIDGVQKRCSECHQEYYFDG